MAFCIPPKLAEEFKRRIVRGEVDPVRLSGMSSAERRAQMAEHFGEDIAEPVNALFESKMLLKNQQTGMVNWAKRVTGITEPARRDIISRIERMDKILSPAEEKVFLEDLAAQRLGTHVSYEEAGKIAELSKRIEDTKDAVDRMEYGRAVVALKNYVGELKANADKMSMAELKRNPGSSVLKGISTGAGVAKSMVAALDLSALGRQGWKLLFAHPEIWQKNARKSFVDIVNTFGKKAVMDEVNAEIISRPNVDLMRRAKLDVGVTEEAYPSTLPHKIPWLGKLYQASDNAYTGFMRRTRADVFDKMIEIVRESALPAKGDRLSRLWRGVPNSEVELTTERLLGIGKMINSLTGRGDLGRLEPIAKDLNNVFFSPRFLKANIDFLLLHPFDKFGDKYWEFERKQAALNLLKVIGGTAAVLATARALRKESVELDPLSANSGKIRVGNTRFDVSGGMASIATLATRLARDKTKDSTTGKIRDLRPGKYGDSPVYDFFENKLSPAAGVVNDLRKGETRSGEKPTIANEAVHLFAPIAATNYVELKNDPNSANILLAMIADALGISTNTYSGKRKRTK